MKEDRADSRFLCVILWRAVCLFVKWNHYGRSHARLCGEVAACQLLRETMMEGHMCEHEGNHHGRSHAWTLSLVHQCSICHVWWGGWVGGWCGVLCFVVLCFVVWCVVVWCVCGVWCGGVEWCDSGVVLWDTVRVSCAGERSVWRCPYCRFMWSREWFVYVLVSVCFQMYIRWCLYLNA